MEGRETPHFEQGDVLELPNIHSVDSLTARGLSAEHAEKVVADDESILEVFKAVNSSENEGN